jgi:hypothetical protein
MARLHRVEITCLRCALQAIWLRRYSRNAAVVTPIRDQYLVKHGETPSGKRSRLF